MPHKSAVTGAQAPPYQEVRAIMHGHPFTLTHAKGAYPYHVMGRDQYQGVYVHLRSAAHAQAFLNEIEGHRLAPPSWKAPFPPYPQAIPWIAGYMQAKKICLPFRGPFLSVAELTHSDFSVPYDTVQARRAFYQGAQHYSDTVRNISHELRLCAEENDHPAGGDDSDPGTGSSTDPSGDRHTQSHPPASGSTPHAV